MSKSLKNIGVISFLTVVSRVLGLVRDQLSAYIFGASVFNSAFVTAFNLPNLFRRLLAEGSLTAAFIPTLQHELVEGGRDGAFALLNQVVSWLVIASGGVAAAGMLVLAHARMLSGHEDRWYLAADLAVMLFPYLALVSLAAAFNATLNVLERFAEPALSPIWLNLAMIASLGGAGLHFAHDPMAEVHWLCAGVLIGGFFQMAVPAAVLVREGWRPRWNLVLVPRVREIAGLMAPGLIGTAIYQVNVFTSRLLAYSMDDWAATLLFYANRLMELPIGVFAVAVSTVVYPLIARHAALGKQTSMAADFRKGLRLILVINVPAAAGLAILSSPIVRLIYQHGRFTPEDTLKMVPLVVLFVIGMPFFSIVNLTVRAFYAVKDTSTPVKVALIDFCVNLILSLVLMGRLGPPGLVIASTTAIIVQAVLLQRALVRKLPEMSFRPLLPSLGKVILASAAMSAAVAAGWMALERVAPGHRWADAVAIAVLIPTGIAVYASLLWLLRIDGRDELAAMLKRLLPSRA